MTIPLLSLKRAGVLLLSVVSCTGKAPSGPWDNFNYAPASKTVYATAIHEAVGQVTDPSNLLKSTGSAQLSADMSWVTLDFGKEVGGLISIDFGQSSQNLSVHLSFSESPAYIRPLLSDDSNFPDPSTDYDGALAIPSPLLTGRWVQPAYSLRGGFRYLTLTSTGSGSVSLGNISCTISFMPHVEDLRAYEGYFYAEDPVMDDPDFLTKIWYSGAYTVQTNTVPLNTGRFGHVQVPGSGNWLNNGTLGDEGPTIVDGAKRDRAVWPGDMGIAVPTQFVSTYDMIPTKNALHTMFTRINPTTGALPESGPPLNQLSSDTYHAWTLIGTYNYHLYTGDDDFLRHIWANYTKAVAFLEGKVQNTSLADGKTRVTLMNVTGLRDWARLGGGGFNAEGNAILYRVLITASALASHLNLPIATSWTANATALKTSHNQAFWLPSHGMYKDNLTDTTLCPQDANSMAVLFNLTDSEDKAKSISAGLQKNWGEFGAEAPELPGTISPFIGGFELQAHFIAGDSDAAMRMLRLEWGYMLYTNLSVQSTLLEGYTTNGSLGYRGPYGYNFDPAYTSHAHGWSSAPTLTLTTYVLGLSVTSPNGATWSLAPHLAGLPAAEGGFSTGLGWYGVKWNVTREAASDDGAGTVQVETPAGTSGVFKVPQEWRGGVVRVDGEVVDVKGDSEVQIDGGSHVIVVG